MEGGGADKDSYGVTPAPINGASGERGVAVTVVAGTQRGRPLKSPLRGLTPAAPRSAKPDPSAVSARCTGKPRDTPQPPKEA